MEYTVYGFFIVFTIIFINVTGMMAVIKKMNDPVPRTGIPEAYMLECVFLLVSVVLGLTLYALVKDIKVWREGEFLFYKRLFTTRVPLKQIQQVEIVKRIHVHKNLKTVMFDTKLKLINGQYKTIISHRFDELDYAQEVAGIIRDSLLNATPS